MSDRRPVFEAWLVFEEIWYWTGVYPHDHSDTLHFAMPWSAIPAVAELLFKNSNVAYWKANVDPCSERAATKATSFAGGLLSSRN